MEFNNGFIAQKNFQKFDLNNLLYSSSVSKNDIDNMIDRLFP